MKKFDLRASVSESIERLGPALKAQAEARKAQAAIDAQLAAQKIITEIEQAELRSRRVDLQRQVMGIVSDLAIQTVGLLDEHGKLAPLRGRRFSLRRSSALPVLALYGIYESHFSFSGEVPDRISTHKKIQHVIGLGANGCFNTVTNYRNEPNIGIHRVKLEALASGGLVSEMIEKGRIGDVAEIDQVVDIDEILLGMSAEEQPLVDKYQKHFATLATSVIVYDSVPACMKIEKGPFPWPPPGEPVFF